MKVYVVQPLAESSATNTHAASVATRSRLCQRRRLGADLLRGKFVSDPFSLWKFVSDPFLLLPAQKIRL